MAKKSSAHLNRPTIWKGFSRFPKELFALAQLRKDLISYAIGTLLAALLISFLIGVVGFMLYLPIHLTTGTDLSVFSNGTSSLNSKDIFAMLPNLAGSYLISIYPNLIADAITLILISGWWQVYRYEGSTIEHFDVLLDKEVPSKRRLEALDNLNKTGKLTKGRLQGKIFVKLDVPGYNWNTADLQNVTFVDGNLSKCDFRKANLQNAIFRGTDLNGANFSNIDLTGVDMKGAQNAYRIVFNIDTKLPIDSNNPNSSPIDKDRFNEIKRKALRELEQNSTEFTWRIRLWSRFTKETQRIEVPSEGKLDEEKQINALRTKYTTLIEEFKCTAATPSTEIYATAYVYKSIWFPIFAMDSIAKVYEELREKYWKAHEDVLRRGIRITRIFVIETEEDLHQKIVKDDDSQTVIDFILRQDKATNLETGICKLEAFNSSMAANINSGTEDFIIFADKDNLRCYLLSSIETTSGGSIIYAEDVINKKIEAFRWLFNNRNYMTELERQK